MIPGCTHAIDLELDDHSIDLSQATNIYVTIAQGSVSVVVSGESVVVTSGYQLTVYLTQEQSLKFSSGSPAKVQVNWIYAQADDRVDRAATEPFEIPVGEQLLKRVLP